MALRIGRYPIEEGRGPVRELCRRDRKVDEDRSPMEEGMDPDR